MLEQIGFREECLEYLLVLVLQLLRLDLTTDGLHAFLNLVHQGQQVFFDVLLDLVLLSKSIREEVFKCYLLDPVSDRIEDFNNVCLLVLKSVVPSCIIILAVYFRNQGMQLFLAVRVNIWSHHSHDLILSCFRHFPDELSLHEEVLNAEPDVGDVVLSSHHQVERVQLMSLDSLFFTEVDRSTCFTASLE